MVNALCGKYPCHHICSRVEHCPAGQERVRWYALLKKASRPVPPGVDPFTGEILISQDALFKLHHLGENHHKVTFTPLATMPASPPHRAGGTSVKLEIDRAVSASGFPACQGYRYGYTAGLANRSIIAPLVKALPETRKARRIAWLIIAVVMAAFIWGCILNPAISGNRAQVGHTYNGHGVDITNKK